MPTVMGEIEGEEHNMEGGHMDMEGFAQELGESVVGAVMGALAKVSPPAMNHGHHGHHGHHGGRTMHLPAKPAWRQGQIAPGVHAPDEGLEIMPMAPSANAGIFTNAITQIAWTARPQRPFQGQRLLTSFAKNGTTAQTVIWLASTLFIGTDPQQLQIANFSLEVFQANAFGVRMKMVAAEPGIDITLPTFLSGGLTSPDTVVTQVMILGSSVR